MLYVFLVDTGNMIQLDMNLALEVVGYLKGVIARSCCIPPEKQVLLISGGESLDDEERVCKYSAGTDTNPIFLFSLASIDNAQPPEITTDFGTDTDLVEKIEAALNLKDTQNTVSVRAALAQEVVKASTEQTRICEMLIHDQHLQHQGWAAAVANLEDTSVELQRVGERFDILFKKYLNQRERYQEFVECFDDDMALLHRIPVFPSLLKSETASMIGSVLQDKIFDCEKMSLYEWISCRGSSQSLEQLADSCYRSLSQLDPELLTDLESKVVSAVEGSQNQQMKEIRGLGDRLSALEQLLIDARRIVQEQTDLAKAIIHNQQRASGLNDPSVLPDLCASHRQQLLVMRQNHQNVISIRSRCAKAKSELSANLHHRMKWVVYIQNQMAEVKGLLFLHSEELKRLEKRLQVIEQLHLAPSMYLAASVEVVRRRAFAKNYLVKANCLADKFSQIYDEEVTLRSGFQSKLKKHFLSKMFPGMDDVPPEFATNHPDIFDDRLPEITLGDVEALRKAFPDLAKSLSLPDETALEQLLTRSFNQKLTPEEGETLFSLQNLPTKIHINSNDIGSVSVMNRLLSDNYQARKKFSRLEKFSDSETDTENVSTNRRRQNRKRSGEKLTRSLPPIEMSAVGNGGSHLTNENHEQEPSSSSGAPSSSSGANTANCSSVAPSSSSDGSKVNSQQWPPTSDDKSVVIANLNCKVSDTEARISKIQEEIRLKGAPTLESVLQFKQNLTQLRSEVTENRDACNAMFNQMSKNLGDVIETAVKADMEGAVKEAVESLSESSQKEIEALKYRIEIEVHKLEDCQREVENYRSFCEQTSTQVDQLKEDLTEERTKFAREKIDLTAAKDQEREEAIKNLTLEHELELESVRQKLEEMDRLQRNDSEVARLKEELSMRENDMEALKRKTRLLEMAEMEKFSSEKEKIVQILEAGFAQREKFAVQQSLEAAEAKHKEELSNLEERLRDRLKLQLENIREKLKADFEKKLSDAKSKFQRDVDVVKAKENASKIAELEELKKRLSDEKESELKAQAEALTAKAKREIDGLRQRFKIMQAAGALERSPSASESELSLESPRQDVIENLRSALWSEFETNLKTERENYERLIDELRQQHKKQLEDVVAKGKFKNTAEQQVFFNEALRKVVDEKNAELENLQADNRIKEETITKLLLQLEDQVANGDVVDRLAELTRANARLEMELQEARANLDKNLCASVMPLPHHAGEGQDVARLQRENQQLKDQLSKSMVSLVKSGRINVNSVDKGDPVMIVWNEEHNHYMIYTEGIPVFYFLHSESLAQLGLDASPRKFCITAEVFDKEYCQARKPENRFRVPMGTKFYRVKCRLPDQRENTPERNIVNGTE